MEKNLDKPPVIYLAGPVVIINKSHQIGMWTSIQAEEKDISVPFVRQSLAAGLVEALEMHEKHTPTLLGERALAAYHAGVGK